MLEAKVATLLPFDNDPNLSNGTPPPPGMHIHTYIHNYVYTLVYSNIYMSGLTLSSHSG